MSHEIYIGIDIGSTTMKAGAFDGKTGTRLARASATPNIRLGGNGQREQSAIQMASLLDHLLLSLQQQVGKATWKNVAGLGLGSQGGSAIVCNRESGRALTPMILWNDARARHYFQQIAASRPLDYWRKKTRRDLPGDGLSKMLWLKKNRPDLVNSNNIYVGVGEFLYYRLTHCWRQDACNALQIGCYNTERNELDAELMRLSKLPLSFVAPLRRGHETAPLSRTAARRLGLEPGIPVAGPYMDHEAGYLSAVDLSSSPLQCSLGTAWVGNLAVMEGTRWSSPFQFVLPAIYGSGRLIIQPSLTGNVTWNWALKQFADADQSPAIRKAERIFLRSLLPSNSISAIPWLNINNPLEPASNGAAALLGVGPCTDSAELLRAVAASMCFEMARIFASAVESQLVDSVVLSGGASHARFFRLFFAALFPTLPVYCESEPDSCGCRGAIFPFSRRAARPRVQTAPHCAPRVRQQIDRSYRHYLKIFEHVYGDVVVGKRLEFHSAPARSRRVGDLG